MARWIKTANRLINYDHVCAIEVVENIIAVYFQSSHMPFTYETNEVANFAFDLLAKSIDEYESND
jgi:hypothetical protein